MWVPRKSLWSSSSWMANASNTEQKLNRYWRASGHCRWPERKEKKTNKAKSACKWPYEIQISQRLLCLDFHFSWKLITKLSFINPFECKNGGESSWMEFSSCVCVPGWFAGKWQIRMMTFFIYSWEFLFYIFLSFLEHWTESVWHAPHSYGLLIYPSFSCIYSYSAWTKICCDLRLVASYTKCIFIIIWWLWAQNFVVLFLCRHPILSISQSFAFRLRKRQNYSHKRTTEKQNNVRWG